MSASPWRERTLSLDDDYELQLRITSTNHQSLTDNCQLDSYTPVRPFSLSAASRCVQDPGIDPVNVPVAGEKQVAAVGRKGGALLVAGGVDGAAQVAER